MSNTLGPLPPPNVPADCELSDDFCAYDDWYSAEQMEAERQRCYALGVSQERERAANLAESYSDYFNNNTIIGNRIALSIRNAT